MLVVAVLLSFLPNSPWYTQLWIVVIASHSL